jgi:hypothetical protein
MNDPPNPKQDLNKREEKCLCTSQTAESPRKKILDKGMTPLILLEKNIANL